MLTWNRNVDELDALYAAVKCLQTIPSPHLKEGRMLPAKSFCCSVICFLPRLQRSLIFAVFLKYGNQGKLLDIEFVHTNCLALCCEDP